MIKRTLQDIADFLGCWVAVDESRLMLYGYHSKPKLGSNAFSGEFIGGVGSLEIISDLPEDWKDSLTAPSELPFKEGELLVSPNEDGGFLVDRAGSLNCELDEYKHWRRPTEAEWRVLRGEE